MSTLGSALGTLVTSFYFVLWFEMNTILTLLTASLVAMGAIALIANSRLATCVGKASVRVGADNEYRKAP